jgi:hypothetical protein
MSTVTLTGDDYRYRFEVDARERLIGLLRERFNAGVRCKGRVLKWDTVIEQKTSELGRFLLNSAESIDFSEPLLNLRSDSRELRTKILALTYSDAKQLGIRRSTLHYLRKRAKETSAFTVYAKIGAKLK